LKKRKKTSTPPCQPNLTVVQYAPLTTQEGLRVQPDCLVGMDKEERKPKMFAMKQNKSWKLSDNRQHLSFCLNSIECCQLSYREDSACAGSQTF